MSFAAPVRRTAAAAAITGGVAIAGFAAAATPAFAKTTHKQKPTTKAPSLIDNGGSTSNAAETATGNYSAGPISVQFNAQRAAGAAADQATGEFTAHMSVGGMNLMTLQGPVTCLDENGPDIGLFYPVTSSSPAAIASVMKGVYVTLEMGANGQPLSMSFHPAEVSGVSNCAPAIGMIPITSGTATETN